MEHPTVSASAPYTDADVLSINTGRANQWAYSPSFTGRKLLASTQIKLTGSRRSDYAAAENQTPQKHVARKTVWHHVYDFNGTTDVCTMQLVNWRDHVKTIPHAGGCSAYAAKYGRRYRLPSPGEEPAAAMCDIPAYSAKELEEFSRRTGLTLTPEVRRFYNGNFRPSQTALDYAVRQDFTIDAFLPLQDQEGASVEGMQQLLKGQPCTQMPAGFQYFAVDACGGWFCAAGDGAVWFYDHEADQYCETDLNLNQLME